MARVTKLAAELDSAARKPATFAPSAAAVEERQLIRRAQKADKAAFEILVQRHQHRGFAVARGILKRQEDVGGCCAAGFRQSLFFAQEV